MKICELTSFSSAFGFRCNPNLTFEYFFMNTRHTTYAIFSILNKYVRCACVVDKYSTKICTNLIH